MKAEIARHQDWLRARVPHGHSSGTCIIPFSFHHADELMRDMGLKTRRTRNPIREFMAPFNPAIYKGVGQELNALYARQAKRVRANAAELEAVG